MRMPFFIFIALIQSPLVGVILAPLAVFYYNRSLLYIFLKSVNDKIYKMTDEKMVKFVIHQVVSFSNKFATNLDSCKSISLLVCSIGLSCTFELKYQSLNIFYEMYELT